MKWQHATVLHDILKRFFKRTPCLSGKLSPVDKSRNFSASLKCCHSGGVCLIQWQRKVSRAIPTPSCCCCPTPGSSGHSPALRGDASDLNASSTSSCSENPSAATLYKRERNEMQVKNTQPVSLQ